MPLDEAQNYVSQLTVLARQLNTFADGLKQVRSGRSPRTLRELAADYQVNLPDDFSETLLDPKDLAWLES